MQLVSGGAWRKYFKVAEISFTNRIVYLADHFASSIFLILILFIFSQLWKTVLGPSEEIAGLNSTAMLWYMLFTEMIALSTPRTCWSQSRPTLKGCGASPICCLCATASPHPPGWW